MASSRFPNFSGGIMVPVQAGASGGFKLLFGDEYLLQLVRTRAGVVTSNNPFQEVGIAARAVFQNISDPGWVARHRFEIQRMFVQFERAQLARLKSIDMAPHESNPAEYVATIKFVSIETESELEVQTSIARA